MTETQVLGTPNGVAGPPTTTPTRRNGERAVDRVERFLREHPETTHTSADISAGLGGMTIGYVPQLVRQLIEAGKVRKVRRGVYRYIPEEHRRKATRAMTPSRRQAKLRSPEATPEAQRDEAKPPRDGEAKPLTLTFTLVRELRDGRLVLEFDQTGDAFVAERI